MATYKRKNENELSLTDQALLDAAQKAWQTANANGDRAAMDAAHRTAENIRNKYGYSGGDDGGQYIPTTTTTQTSTQTPSYVNRYQGQMNSAYVPIDNSGNDYAGMVGMSDIDRTALDAAQQSWINANAAGNQAAMDAAHAQAEAIRAQYNYSGGQDGSQYIPWQSSSLQYGNFTYPSAPTYENQYEDEIDQKLEEILERDPFSYDPNTDPLYGYYSDMYTRGGQRAAQDTLGQVSSRTGGLASSYAQSVANQTYNNYMADLANVVPELQQLAYAMYQDEGDVLNQQMSLLQSLEQGDYAKFADQLAQYNTDRDFAYNDFSDDRNLSYQLDRDAIDDGRYEREWLYGTLLDRAQLLASMGDYSGYAGLGLTDSQIAALENAYQLQNAISAGSGGGGGGGGGSNRYNGDEEDLESSGLYNQLLSFDNEGEAYAFLVEGGYRASDIEGLMNIWRNAQRQQSGTDSGSAGANNMPGQATDTEYQSYKQNVDALIQRGGSALDFIDQLVEAKLISQGQANALMDYALRKEG